jgi:hypothetical protein
MKKDISARLAEKLAHSDSQHAKRNLAIFFVLRDEINSAINTGWSVKDIWQLLHEEKKILISYQVFLRLVKKHTEYTAFKRKGSGKKISKPKTEAKETQKLAKDAGKAEGFEWNNESNLDDLVG